MRIGLKGVVSAFVIATEGKVQASLHRSSACLIG